jgi:hypothetical protein
MISRRQLPELRRYATVENELPIVETPELAQLVVPNGNSERPGYRWFKFKEAFSADLLSVLLERLSVPPNRDLVLMDPFCGVGTTLLSAQLASSRGYRFRTIGIECNPLAELISRTKLAWHQIDVRKLRKLASSLLESNRDDSKAELPSLSSISTGRCISRTLARQVVGARDTINALRASPERDAMTVALASTVEPLSKVRRDGRALRLVEKPRRQFKAEFATRLEAIATDIELLKRTYPRPVDGSIHFGDGREPKTAGITTAIDLLVTSPPYPNNIDYNEVYKLELWLLGFATNATNFLELRRRTFRSHPTCSPPDTDDAFSTAFQNIIAGPRVSPLLHMITNRVERIEEKHRRGRSKVLLGYAFDTWRSLVAHYRLLRNKGTAVYVVGNSLHGGKEKPYLIPTDLLFARLAQDVGFIVDSVMIARPLQRRVVGNHFLRDSVVVLKKP